MEEKTLFRILAGEEGVFLDLRMGNGFDPAAFEEVLTAIRGLRKKFTNSEFVPKKLAYLLVDLPRNMESSAYIYPENLRSTIFKGADQLSREINLLFGADEYTS